MGGIPDGGERLLRGTVVAGVDEAVPDVAADPGVGQRVQAGRLLVPHHRNNNAAASAHLK